VLAPKDRSWLLSEAGADLRAQSRLPEAVPPMRAALQMAEDDSDWWNCATRASNLSEVELLLGHVAAARATAERAVEWADREHHLPLSMIEYRTLYDRTTLADAQAAAGAVAEAEATFDRAEALQRNARGTLPFFWLYSVQGYRYCDLLLFEAKFGTARDRAAIALSHFSRPNKWLLSIALDTLALGRAYFGLALSASTKGRADGGSEVHFATELYDPEIEFHLRRAYSHLGICTTTSGHDDARVQARNAAKFIDGAVEDLRGSGSSYHIPRGLIAHAAFRRAVGDWDGAVRDLDEVEEIAKPGAMRLYLCDCALERARLALARREAFAPLTGLLEKRRPRLLSPAAAAAGLRKETRVDLDLARKLVAECGYHRRDEELAELDAVIAGARRFADLRPRV
jgi:tetratricopeptide (TPR) repeat protein